MRLIDADKINFEEVFGGQSDFAKDIRESAQSLIDIQPTVFDKEKVIEELKEMATHSASCKNQCEFGSTEYFNYMGAEAAYKTTIEIVEKGGVE